MKELTIKEEFKKLIPPLTPDEYSQLEKSCISEGIREAIIIWKGIIVDGHNRYNIATANALNYRTVEMKFKDEFEVKRWMILNQMGRRNLSTYNKGLLALELKVILQQRAKEKEALRKTIDQTSAILPDDMPADLKAIVTVLSGYKKQPRAKPDKIYFAQDFNRIKIGVGVDVESRMHDIRKHIPSVHLVGVCSGDVTLEKSIHKSLAEYHLNNEWFVLNDVTVAIIKAFIPEADFCQMAKVNSNKEASKEFKIGERTLSRINTIQKKAPEEIKNKVQAGDMSINEAYNQIRKEEKKEAVKQERERLAEAGKDKKIEIDFRLGDFEEVFKDIPDGSVDCIITDPPYPFQYIECWTKLSRFAKRVLKPNGYCIAYSGQMYLPEVMQRMSEHLDYYWTFAVYHEGQTQIVNGVNLICRWKPVLIFQNGKKKIPNTFQDYFISKQREKGGHDWQQSKSGVAYLVEMFTKPGDLICEPFAGSGTTIVVAEKKGRRVIAAEIDEQTYNIAKATL